MAAEISRLPHCLSVRAGRYFCWRSSGSGLRSTYRFYNRIIERRWAAFPMFSVLVSAVFTVAAMLFGDSLFIKISPACLTAYSVLYFWGWPAAMR